MIAKDSRFFSTFEHNQMLVQRPLDIWTCTIFVSICCQFTPKGDVVNHGVDRIPIVAVLSRGSCCFTMRQNDIFTTSTKQTKVILWTSCFTAQATQKGLLVFSPFDHPEVSAKFGLLKVPMMFRCVWSLNYHGSFWLEGRLTLPINFITYLRIARQFWVDDFPFPVWWDVLLPLQAYFKGLSSH